jgi:ABC-type antimicrobial peptide transport system permease subunit
VKRYRLNYYFWGLTPAFLLAFIFFLFIGNTSFALFFLVGFVWPFAMETPGLAEKAESPTYRFSFLGMTYRLQKDIVEKFSQLLPKYMIFSRLIPPLVFSLLMFLIDSNWGISSVLLGWAFFELFYHFFRKRFSPCFDETFN